MNTIKNKIQTKIKNFTGSKKKLIGTIAVSALALTLLIGGLSALGGTTQAAMQSVWAEARPISSSSVTLALPSGWQEATPANNPNPAEAEYYWYGSEYWKLYAVNGEAGDMWVEHITLNQADALRAELKNTQWSEPATIVASNMDINGLTATVFETIGFGYQTLVALIDAQDGTYYLIVAVVDSAHFNQAELMEMLQSFKVIN